MPPPAPLVLVASPPHAPADDIRDLLTAAGFAVESVRVGTGDRLDFGPVSAVVVVVGSVLAPAAAQTRLWKAEAGDAPVPVLWVLPFASQELTVAGFDAGADAVVSRPLDAPVVAAQVRALARSRAAVRDLAARADEASGLNDHLQKAYAQIDAAIELGRKIQRALLPRTLPEVAGVRFAVHQRSRSRVGGDVYDVARLDENHVGFWVADPGGPGSAAGGLLGLVVKQSVVGKEIHADGYRLVPPDAVLARANRDLIGVELDPPPLVALGYGQIDVRTGRVAVSRGGLPPAVYLPATGPAEAWVGPAPFLGAFDAEFPPEFGKLSPGDRLILATDGGVAADGGSPLPGIAEAARNLSGQAFADAVAHELLAVATDPDDLTVLVAEAT